MKLFIPIFFLTIYQFYNCQINNLTSLIQKTDPSVIKIYTLNNQDEYEKQGSGVIISNNGICVTNYHVLIGAKKAIAINSKGKKLNIIKIIDYSKTNDLIKFQLDVGQNITPPVVLNLISPLKGARVFSVGYPNGFILEGESTVSEGIISGFRTENNEKIIQTTTPFTHGSSGGGLFDSNGKLVGITQGTFSEEIKDRHANLNRVIPSQLINKLNQKLNLTLTQFYDAVRENENFIIAMIAYENENFEMAKDYFSYHLQDYPEDALAWMRIGNCMNQIGRISKNKKILSSAIECFNISISLDSTNYNTWGQCALVHCISGNIEFAKNYAKKAFELNTRHSFTNYVMGKVANVTDDFPNAIKYLTNSINYSNSYDLNYLTHQRYLERAIAYAANKNDVAAETDFQKCLSMNPQNLDGYFQYGVFLYNRNRKNEACSKFIHLFSLSPNYRAGEDVLKDVISVCCN